MQIGEADRQRLKAILDELVEARTPIDNIKIERALLAILRALLAAAG
jgi:hypothetical protein